MAKPEEHYEAESVGASAKGGAGQSIVELCDATSQGIVFWSRRRFEIGAQLQVRLRMESLPEGLREKVVSASGWVNLIGFVAVSLAQRRADGSHGFRITLLVPAEVAKEEFGLRPVRRMERALFVRHEWLGGWRMGRC